MTPNDRKAKMDEAQKILEAGVENIRTTEGYKAYLSMAAKFHKYSFGNQLLIFMQCRDASRVASYKAWQSLGRQVKKGEKGIRIYAPMVSSRTVTDETTGDEVKVSGVRGFTLVPVFDLSQTDGDDLPSPVGHIDGDAEGLTESLTQVAENLGFRVSYKDMDPEQGGYFSIEDSIVLASGRSSTHTAKTLIHEITHALLDAEALKTGLGDEYRAGAELIAESTAFVACAGLGLDTSNYSFGYLATWGGTPEKIRFIGETVQKTAHKILDTLEVAA